MIPEREFKPVIWCVFAVVLALSGLALLGWLFDIQFLKSVRGDWISMRVATAMCLAGCAVALAAVQRSEDSRWIRRVSRALGVGVVLTGLVSLAAYLWAMQFGLEPRWADEALLRGFFSLPSRMAPVTALIFIGFGSALFLLSSPSPRAAGLAHAIVLPAALLSYMVLISYLFGVNALHTWMHVPVAVNTGLACCALSIGLFLVRPGTWFMRVLASPESGGIIARRLLPAVLAAPLVIVWGGFASERAGRVAAPVGAVLVVIANAVVLLWVLWLVARSANLIDGQRRKMEATLQESEERLRVTLASIGDGVLTTDTAGRITFLNPVAAKLTGWTAEEALGRPAREVFRIINEQTREIAEDLIGRVLNANTVVALANHSALVTGSGGEIPIEDTAAPIRDKAGRVTGVVLVFHDVTEKRRIQATLTAAHAEATAAHAEAVDERNRLRALMAAVPVGMALIDAQGGNIVSNSAFDRIWSGPRPATRSVADYAAYKAWWAETGQPVEPEEWASARAVQKGESVVNQEMQIERFDGTRAFVLNSGVPIHDAQGRITGSAVAIEDITELKRAEEALRLTQASVDGAAEMVAWFTPDGGVHYANDATCRTLGYTRDELLNMTALDFSPGFTWEQYAEHWREVRQRKSFTLEVMHRRKDGSEYPAEVLVNHMVYGGQEYIFAYGRDITSRKAAEDALHESDAKFRSVIENMSEGLILFDPQGNLIYQNPASLRIHGFASQEDGSIHHERVPVTWQAWDDEGRAVKFEEWPVSRVFRGESFQDQVLHVLRPETSLEFDASYNGCPIYDDQGTLRLGFITIRDITAQREVQEALRKSEEEFRTLANAIPQLCWMANADGWIFWYNERWYEYTGTTPEQMEGWGWQTVHDSEVLPNVLEQWKGSIVTGKPFNMVFPLRGGDGVFRPFLTRVMPVRDPDGKVARWFGTNTDISEERKTEEALRESKERISELYQGARQEIARRERVEQDLRRSNADLEQFAFAISHDLRSPLNAVTSFAKQLEEDFHGKLGEDANTYLAYITGASERLRRLIADLLVYSRVATPDDDRPCPRDSQEALRAAELNLQGSIRETGAILTHGPLPQVELAPGLLTQVFQNLLENAIKFRGQAVPTIHVSAEQQGEMWLFCVADNGIGIDPQHSEQVFRIFKRLHGDTYEGTGLGLAVCRKIVERQGGRIWVESALGQGARFYFTLQAAHA